jgi:hypothetical protein
MKKTSSERISGRSSKKEAEKASKPARALSKKAATEKKEVKKVKAKTSGKRDATAGAKVGAKAGIKKEKESAKAPAKERTKKAERKSVVQRRGKTGEAKKRASRYAPKKTTAGKAVAEVKKETKEKARKAAASAKEFLVGRVKRLVIRQAADKHKTKTGVGAKQKTEVVAEKAAKKSSRKALKKMATRRVAEMAGKRIKTGIRQKKDSSASSTKGYQTIPWEKFPVEYGENGITLMPVDPRRLFVFWEVRKDAMESYEGDLTIRVYDVVDDGFNPVDAGSYFDIAAGERMGRRYIDVRPARQFIADIGISHDGIFIAIARSPRVSTPRAGVSTPGEFSRKPSEDDIRVGY